MNTVGIHYGYWTQHWDSEPLQFVKRAQKCGFDILEVNAPKVTRMSDSERDALKGAAADAGLGLTYSIGMTSDMDLTSEDAATRKKGVAFLKDVVRAMKQIGGTVMAGINYSSWPRKLLPGEDKKLLTDRSIEGVREAIKTAEDCDVIFCVEVVNRFEQFMMNTAAEGIAFAQEVGSPNCKILLDTFHMNIEEESIGGSIEEAGTLARSFSSWRNQPPSSWTRSDAVVRNLWGFEKNQLSRRPRDGAVPASRRRSWSRHLRVSRSAWQRGPRRGSHTFGSIRSRGAEQSLRSRP